MSASHDGGGSGEGAGARDVDEVPVTSMSRRLLAALAAGGGRPAVFRGMASSWPGAAVTLTALAGAKVESSEVPVTTTTTSSGVAGGSSCDDAGRAVGSAIAELSLHRVGVQLWRGARLADVAETTQKGRGVSGDGGDHELVGDDKTTETATATATGQGRVVWEPDAAREEATCGEVARWLLAESGGGVAPGGHVGKLAAFPRDKWQVAYASYAHANAMSAEAVEALFSWEELLGIKWADAKPQGSTLWIGSKAATTPLHYDTYGFNIVVQLDGCKRWTLFHPSDTPYLEPTRLPLEESTVHSAVDWHALQHDASLRQLHPLAHRARPMRTVLKPGDVMIVPHRWWHLVEHVTDSIAVNVWLPCSGSTDNRARASEALVQTIARHMLEDVSSTAMPMLPCGSRTGLPSWLNPSESHGDAAGSLEGLCTELGVADSALVKRMLLDALLSPQAVEACLDTMVDQLSRMQSFLQAGGGVKRISRDGVDCAEERTDAKRSRMDV